MDAYVISSNDAEYYVCPKNVIDMYAKAGHFKYICVSSGFVG